MTTETSGVESEDIRVGNACLLSVMNQLFLVEILNVEPTSIRVSFPGMDYPVEGMAAGLEFHDKSGINTYQTVVLEGPRSGKEGILLQYPHKKIRERHRDWCRVSTDLTVQVKDQIHFRRYDASLVNLSAGGALIRTNAPFDLDTTIEMFISLPGEPMHHVLGRVVHVNRCEDMPTEAPRLFGIQFISPDRKIIESIIKYIWNRLREMYNIS